jgi:hypothetical protein
MSSRFEPTDAESRDKIQKQFLIIEGLRDFLEYLFDKEIDYKSQNECFVEFLKHTGHSYDEIKEGHPDLIDIVNELEKKS